MLRVHFTGDDLARVVVRAGPDPLVEAQLAVRALRRGTDPRQRERYRRLADHGLHTALRPVFALVTAYGDTPDFLTPAGSGGNLDAAIEAVAATPPARLRAELSGPSARHSRYARHLVDGDQQALGALVRGLRTAYEAFVAPDAETAGRWAATERATLAAHLVDGGVGRMLRSLCRDIRWRPPVLEVLCPLDKGDGDLYLDGRGLTLQPSFGGTEPLLCLDPGGSPVLSYPMGDPGEIEPDGSVAAVLGSTRARVLACVAAGATTSQIAGRLGISAASASEHAAVLRGARLVTSRRLGPAVLHTLTPLGRALLGGAP